MKAEPPQVPEWIRIFTYPNWTNIFHLAPSTESLYPITMRSDWHHQFNDWNGEVLLLAKDGCPPYIISGRVARREQQPWRYGQRELGDEMGFGTNERLFGFASKLPGGKLYGSATANMLFNDPKTSRQLTGFYDEQLHQFLKKVLVWVVESMTQLRWIACLGKEAWFLACAAMNDYQSAKEFARFRDGRRPMVGIIGSKKIRAFPLYHPAALGNAINEMHFGWDEFGRHLSSSTQSEYVAADARPATLIRQTRPVATKAVVETVKSRHGSRIVNATLPNRLCRVQFVLDGRVIHTGPQYNSGNTWDNIIAYARTSRGGAPRDLPKTARAVPQVFRDNAWVDES